jgi:hypothetical protein
VSSVTVFVIMALGIAGWEFGKVFGTFLAERWTGGGD